MAPEADPHDDLTDDALTGCIRVWQRRRGHRYSLDDVATAWVAVAASAEARVCLDLGCGLGSVLLMAADRLPQARLFGVEAQPIAYDLATANIARNGLQERVSVQQGDLRDHALIDGLVARASGGEGFDLVTGTPPYMPVGTATASRDSQRAHARLELRGGVPEYLQAAARALAPSGLAVVCAQAGAEGRIAAAVAQLGLCWLARLDVIPMAGRKGRLFAIHCFARPAGAPAVLSRVLASHCVERAADGGGPCVLGPLLARDAGGARTEQAYALRRFFGLSPEQPEPASPPLRERKAELRTFAPAEKAAKPERAGLG
ncbi:MAG TPA: methyltransferase domain-containing protein [Polyangiales bacterium]